jgi:hypothetical protein
LSYRRITFGGRNGARIIALDYRHSPADHPDRLAPRRLELTETDMTDKNFDRDLNPASRDFEPAQQSEMRSVVGYGADRKSTGTYFAWFLGAVAILGAVLFAAGFFGSQTRDQANNPSIEKLPTTTGQGSR